MVAGALALAVAAEGRAQRPPAGQPVDVTRDIVLTARVDPPCIAILASGASILLSRAKLEALARFASRRWEKEDERLAFIRGKRARALVALAGAPGGPNGCSPVEASRLGDAAHVVAELLEEGAASVLGANASAPDHSIAVRYMGIRSGPTVGQGEIVFLRGEPRRYFFRVEWWRS